VDSASRIRLHLCPIGIPHEFRCPTPRTCGRPERVICNRCLFSDDPQRQEWIREYLEAWDYAVSVAASHPPAPAGTMRKRSHADEEAIARRA
jgi:hypothetical protein